MASRQAVLGMERAAFFYGSARVFGGVTFLLDGARTALVGENGTGKSTLLKCLAGELELNGGKVVRSRGLRLGEPTNHLDLANIATLERWLTIEFAVPMLIVSHDREFLDRVTERTLFLRRDGMHAFKSRFTLAREELLRRDAEAAHRAHLEDKEIRRLEAAAA